MRQHDKNNNPKILMVDDDPDDFLLARDAFNMGGLPGNFQFIPGGQELIDYLSRCCKFTGLEADPLPCLILLDLNMPGKDGLSVLLEIKNDPMFRQIPVVIFTTSREEKDILKSYKLGASSFIIKPSGFETLVNVMEKLGNYWLRTVSLPGKQNDVY